jgi:hypothetical protein
MYYTIYKITNNKNGKHYIGAHKTTDVDDGYMGSGKILTRAINKYGIENFTKEILFVYDTSEEMFNKEKELVNEEFVARTDTYNLKVGGFGGFDYINSNESLRIRKNQKAMSSAIKSGIREKSIIGIKKFNANPLAVQARTIKVKETRVRNGTNLLATFKGKTHTQEAKDKIGKANSKHQKGKKNSQYDTCWVYNFNLEENKRIQKTEIDEYLSQSWTAGRIFDFKKYKENEIKKKEKN